MANNFDKSMPLSASSRRREQKIKLSVTYEYANGLDQQRAIAVLAKMIDMVRTRSLKTWPSQSTHPSPSTSGLEKNSDKK